MRKRTSSSASLEIRASDQDREATVELLRESCGAGRLTVDELPERIEQAYSARTLAELRGLTADLRAGGLGTPSREQVLEQAIADAYRGGWRLETRSDRHAVMVGGERPNHLLHGILTLCTGVWAVVWAAVALGAHERRLLIEVDDSAQATFEVLR